MITQMLASMKKTKITIYKTFQKKIKKIKKVKKKNQIKIKRAKNQNFNGKIKA